MRAKLLLVASAVVLIAAANAPEARAGAITDTLYFTTYNGGGPDVWQTTATYTGNGTAGNGTFSPGTPINLASTPGADGIVLNPNNNQLLVGGQGTGHIYQVNPAGGNSYSTLNAGMSAYEITVDPSGNYVWGGGSEGGATTITKVPINPTGGAPAVTSVSGANSSVTHITFVPGQAAGTAFYTSSTDAGFGNFGTINFATGVTTALLTNVGYAHGMVYDPFTGDLILGGGNELVQFNPNTDAIVSTLTLSGDSSLDQGAVNGKGALYWADNNGNLVFVDYASTSLIGSANDFVSSSFYKGQLDDIAPLVGAGGTSNVPEPAALGLFVVGLVGLGALRRRGNMLA